jgi:aspartate/methionine/tyrosine aminotransferase
VRRNWNGGADIIHLEIGEPDFTTPANVSQAGIRAIAAGQTRYNPPSGMPKLREAIAEYAGKQRGIQVHPKQVIVGPGAKPILFFPTLALVNPGDEVIYPDPGFPTYEAMIGVAGGVPRPVPLREENQFSFDLQAFDGLLSRKTKLIILNSPSNPTGGVMPLADLQHIARAAIENDCWVLADEIYTHLVFDGVSAPRSPRCPA